VFAARAVSLALELNFADERCDGRHGAWDRELARQWRASGGGKQCTERHSTAPKAGPRSDQRRQTYATVSRCRRAP
jgi:hypothetical protein